MALGRIDVEALHEALRQLNREGGFIASVLTDGDGLPISVTTSTGSDPGEALAAVVPLLQRQAQHSSRQTGLSDAEEVVIRNSDHTRLVCRFFEAGGQGLILACVVPGKRAYRRAMNRAIKAIRQAWSKGG